MYSWKILVTLIILVSQFVLANFMLGFATEMMGGIRGDTQNYTDSQLRIQVLKNCKEQDSIKVFCVTKGDSPVKILDGYEVSVGEEYVTISKGNAMGRHKITGSFYIDIGETSFFIRNYGVGLFLVTVDGAESLNISQLP